MMAISDTRKRFNTLFRQARNRGDEFFEFEGKRYTTEMAKPKAKKEDSPISKGEFLEMEARDKEKEVAKDSSGKYSPDIANRMAIAKQAGYDRESQEGRYGSFRKGGTVKSSASKRADGCAVKGKTKGRMV